MNLARVAGFGPPMAISTSLSATEVTSKFRENVGPPPSFSATTNVGVVDVPWHGVVHESGAWVQSASNKGALVFAELTWKERGAGSAVELRLRPTSFMKLTTLAFTLVLGFGIVVTFAQLLEAIDASDAVSRAVPLLFVSAMWTFFWFGNRKRVATESRELEGRLSRVLRDGRA